MRVGGDFIYDPTQSWSHDLLLIGGGVGINPLFSMLLHHTRLVEQGTLSGKVKLLYSARSTTELLFKVTSLALTTDHGDVTFALCLTQETIDELCSKHSSWLRATYFVTSQQLTPPTPSATVCKQSCEVLWKHLHTHIQWNLL